MWYESVGTGSAVAARSLLGALARAGISFAPLQLGESADGPGLLFFTEDGPQTVQRIHETSRDGLNRVLAVATSADAVRNDSPWRLLRAGASDLVMLNGRRDTAVDIEHRLRRWLEVDRLVESDAVRGLLIGVGRTWRALARCLVEAARFSDAPVLLLGETGTGKEVAARLIQMLDTRPRHGSLVVVDCGTISPELSGSEFFGHVRGAFTGATETRDGAFALADGGTLFLDEIGDLPLPLQTELLRAVQERTYKRLGSNTWRETSFRLVSATNRDLRNETDGGRFRRDLYYRIASIAITLPPLRERTEDIIPLVQHFVAQHRRNNEPLEMDDVVRSYLLHRTYPGNVRDLKQLVARIMLRHVGNGPITVGDIPEDERPSTDVHAAWNDATFAGVIRRAVVQGAGMRDIKDAATECAIDIAVEFEGTLQSAARRLGVTDRALQARRAAKRQRFAADD